MPYAVDLVRLVTSAIFAKRARRQGLGKQVAEAEVRVEAALAEALRSMRCWRVLTPMAPRLAI